MKTYLRLLLLTLLAGTAFASAPTFIGPVSQAPGLPGGINAALNVNAAAVIKATPGILVRITVIAAGSAGNLVVNDLASTSGDAATNEILKIAFSSLTVGQVIIMEWPCATGISVTSVTTSGVFAISFS